MAVKKILSVKVSDLTLDPNNARKHGESDVAAIAASLSQFGQQTPIVITSDNVVIKGNGTLMAAMKLNWTHIDAIRTNLTGQQVTAYAIADNRTSDLSEFDNEKLLELLQGLDEQSLIDACGFDEMAMAELLKEVEDLQPPPEIVEDEVPEPPADPITKPGDLWILGDHRLLCGDSTKAEDVGRLMACTKAAACITDPPYSVDYDRSCEQRGGDKVVHGSYHEADLDPTSILRFMSLVPSNVMIWSYPIDRHFQALAAAYRDHGWEFRKELVWVKDSFSFWMSAKYQQKHEPIMWAVRKGKPLGGTVAANETTVFEYPRPRSHELHPTMKPIELWVKLLENHVPSGEIVYEPFCGSGTTLIAAEQLKRRCYGMEISPAYCDIIVQRWEKLTGKKAVLQTASE